MIENYTSIDSDSESRNRLESKCELGEFSQSAFRYNWPELRLTVESIFAVGNPIRDLYARDKRSARHE